MPKIQFYLYDITHKIVGEKPVIYLFGRTLDGQQICVRDDSFKPYFYVELKENLKEKIEKIKVEEEKEVFYVTNIEQEEKKLLEKNISLLKVFVNVPKAVPAIRDVLKDWEGVKTFEYDILFTRRYLIDKNLLPMNLVQAECEKIVETSKVPVYSCKNIETFQEDSSPKSKILAFDIETYSQKNKRIDAETQSILMLAVYGNNFKKIITWKSFKTNDKDIEFVKSEAEVIERFKNIIADYNPDIITGYFSDGFDFPFIKTRAKKYKIKLDLGLDFSELRIEGKKVQTAEITGIVHVDIFKFIKKIMGRNMETDVFTLEAVSNELLGEHKHEVEIGELTSAWDTSNSESLNKFIKYNLHDAELVFNLCTKLMPNIIELVKTVGLPLFDIPRLSFSQLVEWYVIRQSKQSNELIPNRPDHKEQEIRYRKRIHGAFVYEPIPGFYENIAVFDYRSLYPSIIASHNISPGTFRCECCIAKKPVPYEGDKYWFCQNKKGFVSRIIEDLITRRARIKEMLKKQKNPLLSARSEALKLLANSFYGYLGFSAARWYFIEGAESTTAFGRHYIKKVISKAEEQGFKVLYSDTDSIFILLDKKTKSDAIKFVEQVNLELPGIMELDYENYYPAGIFVSTKAKEMGAKKKYALIDEKNNLKIRGFETVRRNWSFIAKEVQKDVLKIILQEKDAKKAANYVKQTIADLRANKVPVEKMVIFTQLQKEISEYNSMGPHVAAAQRMKDKGIEVGSGSMIKYVIIKGDGMKKSDKRIRDRVRLLEEISQKDYDSEYYIKNQIIPSVERIFAVFSIDIIKFVEKQGQRTLGGW